MKLKYFYGLFMFFFIGNLFSQTTISGKITDANDNLEIIGASILIEGTTVGTITEYDGTYSLQTELEGEQTLKISYTGYTTISEVITLSQGDLVKDFIMTESTTSLDEVVVTGSFSPRSQKESPISMTLYDTKKLQRLSANSQADILRSVPGIAAEGGGGEVASNVFVRGMPSGGQYQFTPLQLDGMPVLSTFGLNSSAHDVYFRNDIGVRNLEFVRGGASTLFGAGSVSGIINYTSVTGSAKQDNKIQLEYADGGRYKVDFLSSGPISENLFYAISGFYRYDEGPLETGLATKGTQIRGNIKKLFNDGKSSLTFYTQFIDDNVQFYLPYPLANDNNSYERPTGNDGETIYTLLTSEATQFSFDTPNGVFETPITNGVTTKGGLFMADLKHSFENNWRLSSKVKYAKYDHWFNLFLDGDGTHNVPETQADYLTDRGLPANATFTYIDTGEELKSGDLLFQNRVLDRQRPMEEMVGEINLTKNLITDNAEHNFTIGTFLSTTTAEDNNWIWGYLGDFSNAPRMVGLSYQDTTTGTTVDYTSGGFINGSGSQTSNRYHTSNKQSIYIADEIKTDKFNFDIGLRYEKAIGIINREAGVGSNNFQKATVSASDIAIVIAGLYKMNSQMNLYGNFSKGYFFPELRGVKFESPGVTQSYETEQVYQAEAGAKFLYEKLSGTLAAFYVTLQDRRSVDFINDGQGGVKEEVAIQSTQTMGLELNLDYKLNKDFSANASFTAQDHQFLKVEGNTDQEGNWLRRQPKVMGTFGLTYDNNQFDASASSNFVGKRFANDGNTVELDPYNIVRIDVGYKFALGAKENVRLGVSVFNVFDAEGITEGSPRQGNAQTGSGEYFVGRPILPRRIFLRATFDF